MVEETRALLTLLGVDPRRLKLTWVSSAEGAIFAAEVEAFVNELKDLGDNPLKTALPAGAEEAEPARQNEKQVETFEPSAQQLEYCVECSACVGSCPVSAERSTFSPKQMLKRNMLGLNDDLARSSELWACLSCGRCLSRCPAGIDFPQFNRSQRQKARKGGNLPEPSHHGILQAITDLQTRPVTQMRTDWAKNAGDFQETGDYFYFVGCLPHFEVTFSYLELSPLKNARNILHLLNRMGIKPVISNDECCCGHDAYWSGDQKRFAALAEKNLQAIKKSGAKTVLFGCPEGYITFKKSYPEVVGKLPFEVIHLTEFLAQKLPGINPAWADTKNRVVTYQDPCRLGRHAGRYEEPRKLIEMVPGTDLVEMERNRENGLCCGTSAWMSCTSCSKAMQLKRLAEAARTGAKTLVTACPKCEIHLTCALNDTNLNLTIKDIYTYLIENLA